MTFSVHHIAVLVSDLARAERFYVDVLGCEVGRRWDDDRGEPRSVWVKLGAGAFLALELASSPMATRLAGAPGWHCVALGIEPSERNAWQARLQGHGVLIERETAFTLFFRDPDANLIGLTHWPVALAT